MQHCITYSLNSLLSSMNPFNSLLDSRFAPHTRSSDIITNFKPPVIESKYWKLRVALGNIFAINNENYNIPSAGRNTESLLDKRCWHSWNNVRVKMHLDIMAIFFYDFVFMKEERCLPRRPPDPSKSYQTLPNLSSCASTRSFLARARTRTRASILSHRLFFFVGLISSSQARRREGCFLEVDEFRLWLSGRDLAMMALFLVSAISSGVWIELFGLIWTRIGGS